MPMKWTGRDIANLMRESKIAWNSGSLSNINGSHSNHCAVGQVARILGADAEAAGEVPTGNLSAIFGTNDTQRSKEAAAKAIESRFGNTVFDVAGYERRIRAYMRENGKKAKPNCKVLDKVKELHVEPKSK